MKLERTHGFSEEDGVARIRALTDYWGKYGVSTEWDGNRANISGKVKGISFNAILIVTEKKLTGEVKVGFLAEKLGGRSYVERKLNDYLDEKNSLEELRSRI